MPEDRLRPVIKANGQELPTVWLNALVDLTIDLQLRLPGKLTLRFADERHELARQPLLKLGASVEVKLGSEVMFHGDVTAVGFEAVAGSSTQEKLGGRLGGRTEFLVVAHDRAYKLARATKVASFENMTVSDIVTKVAEQHGLQAQVQATGTPLAYFPHVDNDLQLIDLLAERTGAAWWIDGTKLHFTTSPDRGEVTLTLSEELASFSARASGLYPDEVKVTGYDPTTAGAASGVAETSTSTYQPDAQLFSDFRGVSGKLGSATLSSSRVNAINTGEATALSAALSNRVAASSVLARGVADGNAKIRPGGKVHVKGAGPIDGHYHVSKVEHHLRPSGFVTRFAAGDRAPTSLVDTLGAGSAARSGLVRDHLVLGKVTSIGKEGPQKGHVRVLFPGLSETLTSAWARVLSPGAGAGRGWVLCPEVDDEVLVGFEDGDQRRPVILGGLYKQPENLPNWDVAGQVDTRRFTSRSGHLLEFKDGPDGEPMHVRIEVIGEEGKTKMRLGTDGIDIEAPQGMPIKIHSGQGSFEIDDEGAVTIKGTKVTIQAETDLAMTANAAASLKANGQLNLEGTAEAALKGAVVSVEGEGELGLKGGMVQIN